MNKKRNIFIGIAVTVIAIVIICLAIFRNDTNTKNDSIFQEIKISDEIKSDNIEMSFKKVTMTSEAYVKDVDVNLPKEDDKIYLAIWGNVINKRTSAIDLKNNLKTKLILDEKYEYDVQIQPATVNNITPLEERDFLIYALVPKNVINVCKSYALKIGYNSDFSQTTLENAQIRYKLCGDVNQFGSAANVSNYVTFKEYITEKSKNYDGLNISNKTDSDVLVSNGNALQYATLEDKKSKFSIQPKLSYLYNNLTNESTVALTFEFNTVTNPDGVYYLYANNFELSSSNGTISIGEDSASRVLDNTYASIHHYGTIFYFYESEYDFNQIKNIINGNDLKIKVMVGKSGSDDIEVKYEVSEKIINNLKQLLEFNDTIEKEY